MEVSVLVITKNEEQDLPGCLESLLWCDDIHIFDSFSDDRTVEIAEEKGAKVTQRKFDGYASQRNAALEEVKYKYPWILILDADERVPNVLVKQINHSVKYAPSTVSGFRIRRRDYIGRKWLKHSQISPYYIRLVRSGKARYHREINEVLQVDGLVEGIDGHFDHFPFSKGLSHWIEKHNRYSSMEAQRWIQENDGEVRFSLKKAIFSKDFSVRRYNQKGIFYKLPCRPLLKWAYIVIWRLGFLDGRAGLMYASLQSVYEYFIIIKTKELLKQSELNRA